MRPYLITIFFLIFGLNFVNAQRFGYIDTDFILNKMPDYKKAQDEINQLSEAWEKEIQESKKKIDGMYSSLQAEQVLLTEEMKKERVDAIQKKEIELKEYQKKIFGFEETRYALMIKTFEHQTHHRGQTTIYIRLQGIKPPQERLF